MLFGSVAGGFIAQRTSLGVPFVLRGVILIVMFGVAFRLMHDIGFTPRKGGKLSTELRQLTSATVEHGWRVPAVKWLMVEGVFIGGVGIYAFYALQPYLLKLYGDPHAYQVAGLVAAIVAGAQILGGVAAPRIRRMFQRRTSALLLTASVSVATLALIGSVNNFYAVVGLIVIWALLSSASLPIRQTYINGLIPSRERASILSFDSMMASLGGVGIQPALGRAADVWGYGPSYVIGAALSAFSLPFIFLSRRQNAPADTIEVASRAAEAEVGPAGLEPLPTGGTQRGSRR
jgi:MFS family permease